MDDARPGIGRRQLLLGGAAATVAAAAVAATKGNAAPPPRDVAGKSVLITGTSSGFGRLMAIDLARSGAKVIASMRNMAGGARPEATELARLAQAEKLDLHLIEIDITRPEQVTAGVAEAERIAGGALDALVNNAGIAFRTPVEMGDLAATRQMVETNLYGALLMSQAALPAMRKAGRGWICALSSQLGRIVVPGVGHYCASKFGLEALFETMAYELAPFGVEVTIIQPGGYPTNIWKNSAGTTAAIMNRTPAAMQADYREHLAVFGRSSGGGSTDPMDVPRAIAEILSMPAGTRPLRRPVHPDTRTSDAMNAAAAQVQAGVLGNGPYAAWHKAVTSG